MSFLDVPGARLSYKAYGTGPVLILIPGAGGKASVFTPLARELSRSYKVLMYDRRGFGVSALTDEQDYSQRLQRDADDAAALLEHVSPSQPAYAFGNSSGAIVTLELVLRHPGLVRRAILHEPPLEKLSGDGTMRAFHENVFHVYETEGIDPAIEAFLKPFPDGPDWDVMRIGLRIGRDRSREHDVRYWLEHELVPYCSREVDHSELAKLADKLVPAAGDESTHTTLWPIIESLSKLLGKSIARVPGGHVGFFAAARHICAAHASITVNDRG